MFVLMHIAMPIGKGTMAQCEAMILKLISDKIKREQFLILSLAEYEQLNDQ